MKFMLCILGLVSLVACASNGKLVTPEQVTWIQKGVTTRDEILKQLGPPNFPEVPSAATMFSTEYESISEEKIEDGKKITRGTMKVRPAAGHRTIAQYFYAEAVAFSGVTSKNFWVCYVEQGIVQNFGFTERAISSC
jgi:hypothetical protein